jgi:cytochrome P450
MLLKGKIYGFYEGHSPVLVLADADLVKEVFINQKKIYSHRRSFPLSKNSNDPNADIFLSNGIRWMRVRYGLEKIMLNNKNTARCLEYLNQSFINTFISEKKLEKLNKKFNLTHQVRLLMVQTMFSVIFGSDLEQFAKIAIKKGDSNDDLYYTNIVAHKFGEAFQDFEKFSLIKFVALMIPELSFIWKGLDGLKGYLNRNFLSIPFFSDPMGWFYFNFINKHVILFTKESSTQNQHSDSNSNRQNKNSRLQTQANSSNSMSDRKFGYFNSFLYLTYNPIIKYNQNESPYRKISVVKEIPIAQRRLFSHIEREKSSTTPYTHAAKLNDKYRERRNSLNSMFKAPDEQEIKQRHFSTDFWANDDESKVKKARKTRLASASLMTTKDIESEDFENWKLTINEALANTLLMFFAGYETTSSAIGFCGKVISALPDQRQKLIDEIKENWKELSKFLSKHDKKPNTSQNNANSEESDENELNLNTDFEDNDDVFESNDSANAKKASGNGLDKWNDLYEVMEKLNYLDMFVKEVLRMFPIANSMVSRKCAVDNLTIDGGNYYIPKGMNIVVDVLSIHYDKVLWGPVDPEIFYPERFLTERNPAAWLPFGSLNYSIIKINYLFFF